MNKYINVIMSDDEKIGFLWSKEDRKPAGLPKRMAYTIGSFGIKAGVFYYILYPKGKKLFQKIMSMSNTMR